MENNNQPEFFHEDFGSGSFYFFEKYIFDKKNSGYNVCKTCYGLKFKIGA